MLIRNGCLLDRCSTFLSLRYASSHFSPLWASVSLSLTAWEMEETTWRSMLDSFQVYEPIMSNDAMMWARFLDDKNFSGLHMASSAFFEVQN